MKKALRIVCSTMITIITAISSLLCNYSVAEAHSLAPWATRYNRNNAGGYYHFAFMDSGYYHIKGNTLKYFWANNNTYNRLSENLEEGVDRWGKLIKAIPSSSSDANVKIIYDPDSTKKELAFMDPNGGLSSDTYHYNNYSGGPRIVFTSDGANCSHEYRSRIMCHELGHLWGIDDLYYKPSGNPKPGLQAIMNDIDNYTSATRHDRNAMRIALDDLFYETYDGKWKYQKSPGKWAKNEWIIKNGKSYYFGSDGIKHHERNGSVPTKSIKLQNGIYEIKSQSNKYICSKNGTMGAVAHLWSSSVNSENLLNQRMEFTRQGDDTYKIIVKSSGGALQVPNSSTNSGVQLNFASWNGKDNQKWYIVDRGNGYVQLVNKYSALAVDIWNNQSTNGTKIQQYTDTGKPAQLFRLEYVNKPTTSYNLQNGSYRIKGKTSGKLVSAVSTNLGAAIRLWSQSTEQNEKQVFIFTRQQDNTYRIYLLKTGYSLSVPDWSYDYGKQLRLLKWDGSDNQKWYIVTYYDNEKKYSYYKLINKFSGLAIDISNNNTADGTKIQQSKSTTSTSQRFMLDRL